jgi:hypothetical protein
VQRHAPKPGDIILRRHAGNPHAHYAVRKFPGLAQVSYGSYEMALGVATRFARHVGADVWHEEEGRFTLLESRVAANTA